MGALFVVGMGPGNPEYMTAQARAAIEACDLICGYSLYVEQAKAVAPDKATFTTSMTQELERCRRALEEARSGKCVAMVCSGDAGVYGMAGLILQMASEFPDVNIEIIPGVTAALSGSAVLGAPLTNDFCVISLSDLLTPWSVIERRLKAAAAGDFSICLYNPASKKRASHLAAACDILLAAGKPSATACGWVRCIGRERQSHALMTLAELRDARLDMFTTVFIGSSETRIVGGRLVTPRGYEAKHSL